MVGQLRVWGKNGTYALIACLCWALLKLLFRLHVDGRDHLDRGAEYIALARHRSYWDAIVLAVALGPLRRVHFIARKGIMKSNPIIQPILRTFSTSIERERFSRHDFRSILTAVKRERIIGLFPEGTTKAAVDAKAGAVHFAKLSGKKILPVNIRSNGPYPPSYPWRYPRLHVSIGRPFDVLELEETERSASSRAAKYAQMSAKLMARVDSA